MPSRLYADSRFLSCSVACGMTEITVRNRLLTVPQGRTRLLWTSSCMKASIA